MIWLKDLNVDSIMFELDSKSGVNQVNSHMFDLSIVLGSNLFFIFKLNSKVQFDLKLVNVEWLIIWLHLEVRTTNTKFLRYYQVAFMILLALLMI
jgi:hypothetical protein